MYNFNAMCCCSHRCCQYCCHHQLVTDASNGCICQNCPKHMSQESIKVIHNITALQAYKKDDAKSSVTSRMGYSGVCKRNEYPLRCLTVATSNRIDDRSYNGEMTASINGSGLLTPVGSVVESIKSKASTSSKSAPGPAQVSSGHASVSNKSSRKSAKMTEPRESMNGSTRGSVSSKLREYQGDSKTETSSRLISPMGSTTASIKLKASEMSSPPQKVPENSAVRASGSAKSHAYSSNMIFSRRSMDGSPEKKISVSSKSQGEYRRSSQTEAVSREGDKFLTPTGSISGSTKSKASASSKLRGELVQDSSDEASESRKLSTDNSKTSLPLESIDGSPISQASASLKLSRKFSKTEDTSRDGSKLLTPIDVATESTKSRVSAKFNSPREANQARSARSLRSTASSKNGADQTSRKQLDDFKMGSPSPTVLSARLSMSSASSKTGARLQMADQTNRQQQDDLRLGSPVRPSPSSPNEFSPRLSRLTASSKKGAKLQMVDQAKRDDLNMRSPVRLSPSSINELSPRLEHSRKSKLMKAATTVKKKIGAMAKALTITQKCPPSCAVDLNYLKKLIAPLERKENKQKPAKVTPKMEPIKNEKVLEKTKPKKKSKKLGKPKSPTPEAQTPALPEPKLEPIPEPKLEQSHSNEIWFDLNVPIRVNLPGTICFGNIWDLLSNTSMNTMNKGFSIMDNKTEALPDPNNNALVKESHNLAVARTPSSLAEPPCKLCITMRPMGCCPPMLARVPVAVPSPAEPVQPQSHHLITTQSQVVQPQCPAESTQPRAVEKIAKKRKVVKRKRVPSQPNMREMCSQTQTMPNNTFSQYSCGNPISQYSICSNNLSGNRPPPNSALTLASQRTGCNIDALTASRENEMNDAFNRRQLYRNRSQFKDKASTPLPPCSKDTIRYRAPAESEMSLQRQVTKPTTSKTLSWNTNAHRSVERDTFYFDDAPISESYLENRRFPNFNNMSQLSSQLLERKQNTCNYRDFQDLEAESKANAFKNMRSKCVGSAMAHGLPPLRNFLPSVQGCNNSMETMETNEQSMQNSMYDYSTFDGTQMESGQSEFVCDCKSCRRAYQDSTSNQTMAASLYSQPPKTFSDKSTYVRSCMQKDVAPSCVHQKRGNANRSLAELKSMNSSSKDIESQSVYMETHVLQDLLASIQVPALDDKQSLAAMPQNACNRSQCDSNMRMDRVDAQKTTATDDISIKCSKTGREKCAQPSTHAKSMNSMQPAASANKLSEESRKPLVELAHSNITNCRSRPSITQNILELVMESNKSRFSATNVSKTIPPVIGSDMSTYSVQIRKCSSPQIQKLASEKSLNRSINNAQDSICDQVEVSQCTKSTCAKYLLKKESNTDSRKSSYACGPIGDKLRRKNLKLCLLKQDDNKFLPTLEEYKVTAYTRVSKKYSFQKGGRDYGDSDCNGHLKLHSLNEANIANIMEELKKYCHRVPIKSRGKPKLPIVLVPFRQKGNRFGTMITICQPDEWRELEVSWPAIPGKRLVCNRSVCSCCRQRTGNSKPGEASVDVPKRSKKKNLVAGTKLHRTRAEPKAFLREFSNRSQSPKTETHREPNRTEYKKSTRSNRVPHPKREVRATQVAETSHKATGTSTRSSSYKRGSSRTYERQTNRPQNKNNPEYIEAPKRGDARPVAKQTCRSQNNRSEPVVRCICCRCNSKTREVLKCYRAPLRGHPLTDRQVHRSHNNRSQSKKKVASHPTKGDIQAFPEVRSTSNRSKASERDYSRTDEAQAQNKEVEPDVLVDLKAAQQTRSNSNRSKASQRGSRTDEGQAQNRELELEAAVELKAARQTRSNTNRSKASERGSRTDEGELQNNEEEPNVSTELKATQQTRSNSNRSKASERGSRTGEGQAQNRELELEAAVELKAARQTRSHSSLSEASERDYYRPDEGQAQNREVEAEALADLKAARHTRSYSNRFEASERDYYRTDEDQAQNREVEPEVSVELKSARNIYNRFEASDSDYSGKDEGHAQTSDVESEFLVEMQPARKISSINITNRYVTPMVGNSRTNESESSRSQKYRPVAINYIHTEDSSEVPSRPEFKPNISSNVARQPYRLRSAVESPEMESSISSNVCYCTRKKCPSKCLMYAEYNNRRVSEVEHKEVIVLMDVRPLRSSSLSTTRNEIVSPPLRHRAVVSENRGQILYDLSRGYDGQPSANSTSFNYSNRSAEQQQQQQFQWDRQQLYLNELGQYPPQQIQPLPNQQSFNQANGHAILLQDLHPTQQYEALQQQPQMETQTINYATMPPPATAGTMMMPQQNSRAPSQFQPDSNRYQYQRNARALPNDVVYQRILAKYGILRMPGDCISSNAQGCALNCPCPCTGQQEGQQQQQQQQRLRRVL
ncbi:uncharacterized protein Dvir_GJ13986 [Drosophila virilis]|uniref:Uncharacterized protein n=1 Tax=Drosophila virilis TaxID=7244 RepID=A0A0Q9WKF7_DROVI|nr:uncharacterized protein Dvir_GJ13986 [Drosophila virilis]